MKPNFFITAVLATALAAAASLATGCNATVPTIISGASFTIEPNLETIDVKLNFGPTVETDIGGSYDLAISGTDYGQILIEPSAPGVPFSIGFALNMNIVNDQNVVNFAPTGNLPSGQPLPIPNLNRAFAQIKLDSPVNQNFDVYAYVDVAGRQWLGAAVILNFLNTSVFPAGLTVSQGFDKDAAGNAQIWGSFFGPAVNSSGQMTTPGGIAVFANAADLAGVPLPAPAPAPTPAPAPLASTGTPGVAMSMLRVQSAPAAPAPAFTAKSGTFAATQTYQYAGQNGSYYGSNSTAQLHLANSFVSAMKQK